MYCNSGGKERDVIDHFQRYLEYTNVYLFYITTNFAFFFSSFEANDSQRTVVEFKIFTSVFFQL